MNIFVLDEDPIIAARYHCDKHIAKMILESLQIICTVYHKEINRKLMVSYDSSLEDLRNQIPYRATHQNHPSTIWAGESLENLKWLKELTKELNREYKRRFGSPENHKSYEVLFKLPTMSFMFPFEGLTPFAQAVADDCRHEDVVVAYRKYYKLYKHHIAYWRNGTPEWFTKDFQ